MFLFVLGAVVLPLIAVGLWLARSTTRAGEALVTTQLSASLARTESTVRLRWQTAQSDLLLLAENDPVQRALIAPRRASEPPSYVAQAFSGMPLFRTAVFRGGDGSVVWRIGEAFTGLTDGSRLSSGSPGIILRAPIIRFNGTDSLGTVEVRAASTAFLPTDGVGGPEQSFVALYDRTSQVWTGAITIPTNLLSRPRFEWNGQTWIGLTERLDEPPVDLVAVAPLDPVLFPFERSASIGIAALGGVAALVVFLAAIGTRRLTLSLGDLATAADAVARGDFGLRLDVSDRDEVGRVAHAFNSMTEGVQTMMRERSQREAMAALGELSATVAHQIRTPLTSIKVDLQHADDFLAPGESQVRGLVSHALDGVGRIESAVAASLQMARGRAPTYEQTGVATVVTEAAANSAPRAAARGVRLETAAGDGSITVVGDRLALIQMLTNIMINAVDAADSVVHVRGLAGNGVVTIEVSDDGEGISPQILPRVSEPFFSTKPGGTGLGLTIARRILDAHRGTMRFASSEGGGTTVTIELRQ
jgi:signal transduction histidine kinase